jgi:hypothetical protein
VKPSTIPQIILVVVVAYFASAPFVTRLAFSNGNYRGVLLAIDYCSPAIQFGQICPPYKDFFSFYSKP